MFNFLLMAPLHGLLCGLFYIQFACIAWDDQQSLRESSTGNKIFMKMITDHWSDYPGDDHDEDGHDEDDRDADKDDDDEHSLAGLGRLPGARGSKEAPTSLCCSTLLHCVQNSLLAPSSTRTLCTLLTLWTLCTLLMLCDPALTPSSTRTLCTLLTPSGTERCVLY